VKLWLSRTGDVPLREQLRAQIILAIVSRDLEVGERLPSTAEVSRRFGIHGNTVGAVYRELASSDWIEWRRGSGFYVRPRLVDPTLEPGLDLDRRIAQFFDDARSRGHSFAAIQSRINRWLSLQPPDRVLVIEPDPDLREILIHEIEQAIQMPVAGVGLDECVETQHYVGARCVSLYDHAEMVRNALPASVQCVFLHYRSVSGMLSSETRPGPEMLFVVVSRWPGFLDWARTVLSAVGIEDDVVDLRDAREDGWERGLGPGTLVVTDSLMERGLPKGCRYRVYHMIADSSLDELRAVLPPG
jgi:DNA-binding transcriptional regulator YhcF (GntR family)